MREWFQVKLQADPTVAEIHIIDFIGDWVDQMLNEAFGGEPITVTAKAFVQALAALPDSVTTLRVHINSPGGDVFGAVNIANALRDQRATKGRTVETIVDGMAASAASLVAMAGAPVRIADNGLLMVHNAWTVAAGNAGEMRKTADVLDKFRDANIIPTYQWHTSLSAEELVALMDAETWMDAQEALAMGFVDEVVQGLRAAASIDPRAAAKLTVPEKYAARVKALLKPGDVADPGQKPDDVPAPAADARVEPPSPVPVPAQPAIADAAEVVTACGTAGLDLAFAQVLIAEHLPADAVAGRIAAEHQARAATQARETEIRALCSRARQDDLADGYLQGGMRVEQVRQQLTQITAKLDGVEIDGRMGPDHGTRRKPVIDVTAVYAALNKPHLS